MFQMVVMHLEGRTSSSIPSNMTGVYFALAKTQDGIFIYDRATVSFTEEHTNMS